MFQVSTLRGLLDIKLSTYYRALVFMWFPILIRALLRRCSPEGGCRKIQTALLQRNGSGRADGGRGGNTCSVALFRVRSSSGIPNAAAARGRFNRRLLGRIQTTSNAFPRWLLNKYKQRGGAGRFIMITGPVLSSSTCAIQRFLTHLSISLP